MSARPAIPEPDKKKPRLCDGRGNSVKNMYTLPTGKFLFIWQIKNCAGGNPQAIVNACLDFSLTGVSIKVANCASKYNLRPTPSGYVDDILPPLVTALHNAGLLVHGWQWVEGQSPTNEALRAAERIITLGLDGFEIDAEGAYKGRYTQAAAYMRELRAQCPTGFPVGLCSYRYPTLHPTLPWRQFLDNGVDYHCPQVYWNPTNPPDLGPVPELERSVSELQALKVLPVFPAGRAYIGDGHPNPTPAEITAFMERAKTMGLPGVTFWAMDFLYLHAGGAGRSGAIKDFQWRNGPGWAEALTDWARGMGYDGPGPE